MLAAVHLVATAVWAGLAGGASAGFLARDALGLQQPLVALAWIMGAALALLPLARRRAGGGGEGGQGTVELVALVLFVSLALGALVAVAPRFDGRSFGGFLAFPRGLHRQAGPVMTVTGRSPPRTGAATRPSFAISPPNLVYEPGERPMPVDWRRCRRPACADAPDEPDLDVHLPRTGDPATAFTRVVRRYARTYVQY